MYRFASLRALGVTLAVSAGLAGASAASATAYTYDFTKVSSSGTQVYSATTGGTTLGLKVTAWHATQDTTWNWSTWSVTPTGTDSVSSATLATWQGYGMGVLYGNDTSNNGTHQIDNVGGGADFIMLQFDQAVTLSSISRNVYSISGVTCCDSDASIYADVSNAFGTNVTSKSTIDLANQTLTESLFTTIAGGSSSSKTALTGTQSSNVWLISSALGQSNDAFKLAGLSVNTTPVAAVPEPASWAMMIGGFGMVGAGMRRRRRALAAA